MNAIVGITITAIVVLLAIFLFSQLRQAVTIKGQFAELADALLFNAADILTMAVGGMSLALVAIALMMRNQ